MKLYLQHVCRNGNARCRGDAGRRRERCRPSRAIGRDRADHSGRRRAHRRRGGSRKTAFGNHVDTTAARLGLVELMARRHVGLRPGRRSHPIRPCRAFERRSVDKRSRRGTVFSSKQRAKRHVRHPCLARRLDVRTVVRGKGSAKSRGASGRHVGLGRIAGTIAPIRPTGRREMPQIVKCHQQRHILRRGGFGAILGDGLRIRFRRFRGGLFRIEGWRLPRDALGDRLFSNGIVSGFRRTRRALRIFRRCMLVGLRLFRTALDQPAETRFIMVGACLLRACARGGGEPRQSRAEAGGHFGAAPSIWSIRSSWRRALIMAASVGSDGLRSGAGWFD